MLREGGRRLHVPRLRVPRMDPEAEDAGALASRHSLAETPLKDERPDMTDVVRDAWLSSSADQGATVPAKRSRGRPPAPFKLNTPREELARPHVSSRRELVGEREALGDVAPKRPCTRATSAEEEAPAMPGPTTPLTVAPDLDAAREAEIEKIKTELEITKQRMSERLDGGQLVTVVLNGQQAALLKNLLAVGLYGETPEAACHFLIADGLAKHFPKAFAGLGFKP